MSNQFSSSTAVLVSAVLLTAGAGHGQTKGSQHQQSGSHNFYITTPQTGEQTAVGSNTRAVQTSVQQTANTYTSQVSWPTQQASSSSRQSRQKSSSRSRGASVQQVSNQPTYQASHQAASNFYTTSNQTANYYANQQQAAQQTVYPAAYVSNASAEKKGLLSRLLHRDSSASKHQHQYHANGNAATNAAKSMAVKASNLAGRMQSGMASWYGGKWHGRKTANGERYNQESMTAAHRTLPFGTVVKVTNERNGRECQVRINNRGPFTKGRILDLSKAAARQLGMVGSGVAKIKMEVVGKS